jgi:hypothetical protein
LHNLLRKKQLGRKSQLQSTQKIIEFAKCKEAAASVAARIRVSVVVGHAGVPAHGFATPRLVRG